MANPNFNSTACQALAVSANNLCKRFSVSCEEKVEESAWVFLCVSIPLAILASAYLLGSCGNSCNVMKGMVQRCRKGRYQHIYLYEEEGSSGSVSSYPVHGGNVVKSSYNSYKLIAQTAAIATLSYLILSIPSALKSLCPGSGSCSHIGTSAFNGCEWAQQWLLEVAEHLIHENGVDSLSFAKAD